MKKALLLATALISITSYCQGKNNLSGYWKEVKRMRTDKTTVSYNDTMFFSFLTGNEYTSQKKAGFIYRGTFKMDDKTLDLGSRFYTVLEHKNNKLVLQDDAGIYEFTTYTPTSEMTTLPKDPAPMPVSGIAQMVGHWSEFKRTADHTLTQVDYQRLIKMMDIFATSKDGGYGYVFATRDADNAPSWNITNYANQVLSCSGKDKRSLKVVKCQENELILEEDGITYFFRKFKQ